MKVNKIVCLVIYLSFAQDLVYCDDFGAIGGEITLTPVIHGKPEEITWKHNGDKVVEYEETMVIMYGSFSGRVVINIETGQLTIKNLTKQDSGQYQSDIWINRKVQVSRYTLTVLDVLQEPQVICEQDDTSDRKKLVCSVESETQPRYEWSGPNVRDHSGAELIIEQEEKPDSVYTCTVMNEAQSRSTSFTLQDCSTGADGAKLEQNLPFIIVPVIVIVIIIIIIIGLTCFVCRCKKRKSKTSEVQMDLVNGEGDRLLSPDQTEVTPDSLEMKQDSSGLVGSTAPSHQSRETQEEEEKQQEEKEDGEKSPQLQNGGLGNLKTEETSENTDDHTTGVTEEEEEHEETDRSNTETPVTDEKKIDTENEEQLQQKESSQNENETHVTEEQKESLRGQNNDDKVNVEGKTGKKCQTNTDSLSDLEREPENNSVSNQSDQENSLTNESKGVDSEENISPEQKTQQEEKENGGTEKQKGDLGKTSGEENHTDEQQTPENSNKQIDPVRPMRGESEDCDGPNKPDEGTSPETESSCSVISDPPDEEKNTQTLKTKMVLNE